MGGVLSRTGRGDRQGNRHSTPEKSRKSLDRGDVRRSQSDKSLVSRSRGTTSHGIEPLRRGQTEGRRFYDDGNTYNYSPQSVSNDTFVRSSSWQLPNPSRVTPEPRKTSAGQVELGSRHGGNIERKPPRELGRGNLRSQDDEDLSDEGETEVPLQALTQLGEGHIRNIGHIQRWQRGNLIGSGSYGKVYLGMNLDSGELFVVKQVVFMGKEQNEDVMQLEQEIALLATLDHENIVKYLGTERNNITNELSIFLEHMPGGSVADLVKRFGALDESVIRKYTREVLEGLLYLHNRGIIHRDIKGQNILVDNRGVCKLADFGASRYLQTANSAANLSFKGTPVFMSPEVIMEQRYSKKSDVWSVGCTVLQMATGNPPFSEFSNHIAALFHITSTTDPPPLPEQLSEEGKDFMLSCFIRDPLERPLVEKLRKHIFCRLRPSASNTARARGEPSPTASSPTKPSFPTLPPPSSTEDDEEQWKKYKIQMSEFKVIARLKRDRSHGDKSAMSDATSNYSREGFGGARTDGYDAADEEEHRHKTQAQTRASPAAGQGARRSAGRGRASGATGDGNGSESDAASEGSAHSAPDSSWTGVDSQLRSVNPGPKEASVNPKEASPSPKSDRGKEGERGGGAASKQSALPASPPSQQAPPLLAKSGMS